MAGAAPRAGFGSLPRWCAPPDPGRGPGPGLLPPIRRAVELTKQCAAEDPRAGRLRPGQRAAGIFRCSRAPCRLTCTRTVVRRPREATATRPLLAANALSCIARKSRSEGRGEGWETRHGGSSTGKTKTTTKSTPGASRGAPGAAAGAGRRKAGSLPAFLTRTWGQPASAGGAHLFTPAIVCLSSPGGQGGCHARQITFKHRDRPTSQHKRPWHPSGTTKHARSCSECQASKAKQGTAPGAAPNHRGSVCALACCAASLRTAPQSKVALHRTARGRRHAPRP